jgi:hypothetical protein
MDELEFFRGSRKTKDYSREYHNGKARLHCTIEERWEDILIRPLVCGDKYKHLFRQRIGVTAIERTSLETVIKGSLGLKAIAEFETEIRRVTGQEIHFEEMRELEEESTFEAPKCGRYTLKLYQLKRYYTFYYEDSRIWHRDVWMKTITEWTNRIYNASVQIKNDPACGCKDTEDNDDDALVLVDLGKIIMLVGCKISDSGLQLPSLSLSIDADIDLLESMGVTINSTLIPGYLLFLTDEHATELQGTFRGILSTNIRYEIIWEFGAGNDIY